MLASPVFGRMHEVAVTVDGPEKGNRDWDFR